MEKGLFNQVRLKNKRWRAKAENRYNEIGKRRWDRREQNKRNHTRDQASTDRGGQSNE